MTSPTVTRPALLDALDSEAWPERVEVLIVGGGPVGLTSAVLLAQRGIDVLLVERRSFEARFPRAHLLNVRTMEIFHEIGVADDIYAQAPADDEWRKVVWYTSVDGPTPLHGLKLGEVPAWGGGPDAAAYATASPRKFANLPQIRLDALLWAHADAACPGRIRAYQELVGLEEHLDGSGMTATVLDRTSGITRAIGARYVIVADGGRTGASLLGIERSGPRAIKDVVSYYVSTDLSRWSEQSALLAHFIQPWGGGRHIGTLQALGPGEYGRRSPEWLVAMAPRPGEQPTDDTAELLRRARAMLGLPQDHPMTLHAVSHWQYEGVVAERFRVGSAFIAGDAAHRHPPTGGLGLNCGVQDAHNLAWKLAAVLHRQADERLLDSYEAERRPIAAYYTAHSLENAGRHEPIGGALGLEPGMSEDDGWREIELFVADGEDGDKRRRLVAEAVADNANDYSQLNVEAGYFYTAGAIVPDGTPPHEGSLSPTRFTPTTRPGHHLPHVWLRHVDGATPTTSVSTLDLVGQGRLTLLVSPGSAYVWREAAARRAGRAGLPISVVAVPNEDEAWAEVRGVEETGAVLVRPDRKVCWRASTLPDDPAQALDDALSVVLGGGTPHHDDPAEPFLARIRNAASKVRPR